MIYHIRKNFKNLREDSGLTRKIMAEFLKMSEKELKEFELGDGTMSITQLEKACNLFGIRLQDIESEQPQVRTRFKGNFGTERMVDTLEQVAKGNMIALNYKELE